MNEQSNPLITTIKEYEELNNVWFKQLLVLSIAALSVLVALIPKPQLICTPDKYFLVGTWILLSLSILSALGSSRRAVTVAHLNLLCQYELLSKSLKPGELPVLSTPDIKKLKFYTKLQSFLQQIAIYSFCLAFVSLAIYACLKTL